MSNLPTKNETRKQVFIQWLIANANEELRQCLQSLTAVQQHELLSPLNNYLSEEAPFADVEHMLQVTSDVAPKLIVSFPNTVKNLSKENHKKFVVQTLLYLFQFAQSQTATEQTRDNIFSGIENPYQDFLKPMIEQGFDQSYTILKEAKLF